MNSRSTLQQIPSEIHHIAASHFPRSVQTQSSIPESTQIQCYRPGSVISSTSILIIDTSERPLPPRPPPPRPPLCPGWNRNARSRSSSARRSNGWRPMKPLSGHVAACRRATCPQVAHEVAHEVAPSQAPEDTVIEGFKLRYSTVDQLPTAGAGARHYYQ